MVPVAVAERSSVSVWGEGRGRGLPGSRRRGLMSALAVGRLCVPGAGFFDPADVSRVVGRGDPHRSTPRYRQPTLCRGVVLHVRHGGASTNTAPARRRLENRTVRRWTGIPFKRADHMFLGLAVVFLVLWLLGFFAFHVASGLIHLLIIVAVISFIVHF